MHYPTGVTINGYHYRIQYVPTGREVDAELEAGCVGCCSPGVVRVLATQEPLPILDTIIHEILHGILLRNRMLQVAFKADMEEPFVDELALQLALILVNNGWITLPTAHPPVTIRINPE